MTTLKSECRKFSPNIFNKAKCQNCFRTKESHSAEALESNRATRKVSKCGYLFVAPDWDFSISINRTKRWQRRWFVLYDDGELTYSVDEHPDTVPQAVIDMNKVLEVSDAENVTGNQFAIAITALEKVHFVKGTSREESKWWFDVLNRLPRNNLRGKHKRNATFPGGKATATSVTIIPDHESSSEDHTDLPLEVIARPRFLSTSEVPTKGNRKDWSWLQIDTNDEDVFPARDQVEPGDDADDVDENQAPSSNSQENRSLSNVDCNNAFNKLLSTTSNGRPILQTNRLDNKNVDIEAINADEQSREKLQIFDVTDGSARKARNRRYQKRENRGMRNQRSRSDGVARMIPKPTDSTQDDLALGSRTFRDSPVVLLLSDSKVASSEASGKFIRNASPAPARQRHFNDKVDDTLKTVSVDHAKQDTPKPSRTLKKSESLMNIASNLSPEMRNRISELKRNHSYKGSPSMYKDKQMDPSQRSKTNAFISAIRPVRDTDPKPQVYGDNDKSSGGGGPSSLNASLWEAGIDISTEDLLLKKGWLMRQTLSKEWSRHWFVLKNASLTYYRDPSAEDCGIMDGVLDLNQVTSIEEVNLDKNFAFCLIMWDNKKYVLAAVSTAVRSGWIKAIHRASNLWDSELRKDFSKDEIVLPEHSFHSTDSKLNGRTPSKVSSSSSPTPEPEKALDLSSSDDQSEYFSIIDEEEGGERSSSPRTLPPSPPINRTPMSLVKERARSRSSLNSLSTRQSNFLSNRESCDTKPEQNGDGVSSDNSSSCTQDSPVASRKSYQDICSLVEDQLHKISLSNEGRLKDFNEDKCSKLMTLQSYCKDLEEKLSLKTREVNEKSLDLDAFRKLKTAYQTLMEQNKLIRKGQKVNEKMSPIENLFEDNYRLKYELLKKKYVQDRMEWESKKDKSGCPRDNSSMDLYVKILQKTKQLLIHMSSKLSDAEVDNDDISKEIQQLCEEIDHLSAGSERRGKRDIETKTMKKAILELQALYKIKKQKLEDEQKKYSSLKVEVQEKDKKIQDLQRELQSLKTESLHSVVPRKFQDEFPNDNLGVDVPDCDIKSCVICLQLNSKLKVGRDQIRRLQKDLKESHSKFDNLEIYCFKLEQEKQLQEESHQSQLALMTARVDDLTSKFTLSEKNLRHLKQKISKLESKQERRRSSLKNKESLSLSKECEAKLFELERKIVAIEDDLKEEKNSNTKEDLALPVCHSQLDANEINMDSERHLRKRLSQDSTSGSENTGILSRLHSLSSRVKSATETLEKQNQENSEESDIYDKPKICFQVRNDEESSNAQEEVGEDWSTLSYATSLTDLQAIDGLDGEFPCSWAECFECLEQRLDNLLSWAKNSFHLMQKQEISTFENFQSSSAISKDTVLLASSAIETLENLPDVKVEGVWGSSMNGDNARLCYKILLLNEVGRTLQKITNYESSAASEKLSICEFSFNYIQSHLKKLKKSDTKCIIDFEKYSYLLEKLVTLSSSSIESLMNESLEEFTQPPQNRILVIQEQCTTLLNLLTDAKHRQFLAIHHMLADVPVQDAEAETQRRSLNKQLGEADPVLINIEALVSQFFEGTIQQFYELEVQNICLTQSENETWVKFCVGVSNSLKYAAQSVIQEIRKLYQQVHEGDVFPFSISDVMYQKVLYACVELMQITLLQTILDSTLILISDEGFVNTDVNNKAWISRLHENLHNKALKISQYELFSTCPAVAFEISFLSHILDSGIREIKMTEQMEAVNHLHQRKLEALQNELETLRLEKCQPKDGCERCEENTVKLQNLQSMFEDISKERKQCDHCQSLEMKIQSGKEQQELELLGLQRQHKEKIEELHKHLQLVLAQKDEIHLMEVKKLEEELRVAHKRLNHLEIEYNEQIQSLRDLYEQKMSLKQDPINEESVRRRYQVEIEQLKGLCEKGLMAMENSYRRITAELERRHKQELNMLEAEKEKVLQEETQATLTALEVMRKAHAEELQREINRFKEEFLKKMQSSHQVGPLHQQQENELEEIKREILSISEKYSVKCLECASLEERVEVLYHQLQEANDQLIDLIARNKQLKVHLAMDIAEKKEVMDIKQESESVEGLKMLLKLKGSEIVEQQEENAQLKQDLHLAQMHVSLLDVQCEQLNQSLKAERRFREDEVSSLRSRLEAIITSSSSSSVVGNEESVQSPDCSYNRGTKLPITRSFLHRSPSLNIHNHMLNSTSRKMLSFTRTKELLRSPSCPGLENTTSS